MNYKAYIITKEFIDGTTEDEVVYINEVLNPWTTIPNGFDYIIADIEPMDN